MAKLYLTTGEVAHKEKVSPQTVRNWLAWGWLKSDIVAGGRQLISQESLTEFEQWRKQKLASQQRKAA